MNKYLYGILILVIIFLAVLNKINGMKIDGMTVQIDQLSADNATLADNLQMQAVIHKNKVIIKTRYKDKIITKIEYLPPEGNAIISTHNDGTTTLKIKKFGVCIEPLINGIASRNLQVGIGSRLMYWNRYGCGVGLNSETRPYGFIDRRIDDFIPFLSNTAIGVNYDGYFGFIVSVFL